MVQDLEEQGLAGYRLSPQQRRLWALRQEGGSYRVQCGWRLQGGLDRAALLRTLGVLVARHEILRTRFVASPGVKLPLQG